MFTFLWNHKAEKHLFQATAVRLVGGIVQEVNHDVHPAGPGAPNDAVAEPGKFIKEGIFQMGGGFTGIGGGVTGSKPPTRNRAGTSLATGSFSSGPAGSTAHKVHTSKAASVAGCRNCWRGSGTSALAAATPAGAGG